MQEDVPAFVRQRVELHDLSPLGRENPSCPDICKPGEVLLVDCVCRDAGLVLHRFCDTEALCSIGCDLGADFGSLVGPARQPRGLKDYRTNGVVVISSNSTNGNSVQHEVGRNTAHASGRHVDVQGRGHSRSLGRPLMRLTASNYRRKSVVLLAR